MKVSESHSRTQDNEQDSDHGTLRPKGPGQVERDFQRYVTSSDRSALDSTLTNVAPELRRIARYYVKNPDLTEDLVQATILTAIERASSFDPERRLVPWMTGILLNKIAAHRREVRRHSLDIEREEPIEPSPLYLAESKEVAKLVGEALEQLPPRYREVLDLYLRQGKRGGEIADELSRPPGTIRAQIHRGLRRLRSLLPPSLALGSLLALRRPAHAGSRAARTGAGTATPSFLPLGLLFLGVSTVLVLVFGGVFAGSRDTTGMVDLTQAGISSPPGAASVQPDAVPDDLARTLATGTPEPILPATTEAGPSLRLVAHDRTDGTALESTEISLVAELADGGRLSFLETTDEAGGVDLPLNPATVERVLVRAERPGYAALGAEWDRGGTVFERTDALRLPLMKTRPIGGRVTDTSGRPVAGAQVYLAGAFLNNGGRWERTFEETRTTSNADGQWHIESASSAPIQMLVRAVHPDFVPHLSYVLEDSPSTEDLWNLQGNLVLERGRSITLRVHDTGGDAPEDFAIDLLDARDPPRFVSSYPLTAEERSSGTLRLTVPEDGRFLLRVTAPGYVPQIQLMRPPLDEELFVEMPASVKRRGTIVDYDGRAVADAQVRRFGIPWSEAREADETGSLDFALNPDGTVWLEVRRGSVIGSVHTPLDLGTGIAKLPAPRRLRVRALDATDGKPLTDHRIRISTARDIQIGTRRVHGEETAEVAFHHPVQRQGHGVYVEVEADGYRPTKSALIYPGSEPLELELALERCKTLAFDVLSPAGTPVDFLEVAIATPGHPVAISSGTVSPASAHQEKVQRSSGQGVRMNRPEGTFALVVTTRSGYALVRDYELDATPTVTVRPWGCVEGHAPGHGPVRLHSTHPSGFLTLDYGTMRDASGDYHLCAIPPGSYGVTIDGDARPTKLEVAPEKTTEVGF